MKADGRYDCCPFDNGICCPNSSHCCPSGFTCAPGTSKLSLFHVIYLVNKNALFLAVSLMHDHDNYLETSTFTRHVNLTHYSLKCMKRLHSLDM